MIDLLITLGAAAEGRALYGPTASDERPAETRPSADAAASAGNWMLPKLDFDDSNGCLTLVEKPLDGFGTLRISPRCAAKAERPVPWHSL